MSVIRVETERLILRKLEQRDAPLYFERISSREAVAKTMLWEPHQHPDETEALVARCVQWYADPTFCRWAIALKSDDTIIGVADLLRFTEDHRCSFAYMIGEEFWGQGYATEALRAIFAYGFDHLNLRQIEADHFSDNPASGRVMQKLGMQHVGSTPKAYEKNGIFHDAEVYTLTKDQFIRGPEL